MGNSEVFRGKLIFSAKRGISKMGMSFVVVILGLISLAMIGVGISMCLSPLSSERSGGVAALVLGVLLALFAVYLFVGTLPNASNVVKFFENGVEYALEGNSARFILYENLDTFSVGPAKSTELLKTLDRTFGLNKPLAIVPEEELTTYPSVQLARKGEETLIVILPSEQIMHDLNAVITSRRKKLKTR